MKYYEGRFLIYDSQTRFKASELTEQSLEMLGGPEAVVLKVHEATGLVLPFMKQKALTDPNNYNIPKWFESMIANSDKVDLARSGITQRLKQANIDFTDEDVEAIVQVPLEANDRKTTAVSAKLLDYTVGDMQATTALRRRVMVDEAPYKHPNKTLNQTTNTDPVSVRLPDADVIIAHTLGDPYAPTPFENTYKPYPNRLYRTKQIVSILTSASPEVRLNNINHALNVLEQSYKINVPDAEARKLRVAFEELPLEHVIGNPDNDTVGIYPSEEPFYENLVEFIKYHTYKFNKEVMVNATDEEIKLKAQQDFDKGVLPVRLNEYLDQLLFDVLDMNFYHTGNFNYVIGDLDDPGDQDAGDTVSDSTLDTASIMVAKENPHESDLNVVAGSYLGLSARTFGSAVWAEGIVKLMRWGDRKVKNLNVGTNNTQYLDLQSMNLITQQLADLSQFEVEVDDEGRTLDILASTYVDFKPSGSKRAVSYPFLLVGVERGYVPGVTESISVTYITTLFDIVKAYTNGAPSVYDLSFDGSKFVDDTTRDDLLNLDLADLSDGNRKVKISEELTDYAIDNNITKMQGTAFSLLRQDEFEDYMSDEPLMERLTKTPKPMRTNVVQGSLLAVFQEGAQNYDNADLAGLLNWYYMEVYPTHLEGYNKLFGFTNQSTNESKLNVKNLPTANFFGQGQVIGETRDEEGANNLINATEERLEFMYPVYEGPALAFNKITRSPKDDTIIGGFAVTEDGTRVFASKEEVGTFSLEGNSTHAGGVLMNLFEIMLGADTTNGYTPKHKVISATTPMSIYKALYGKA